MVKVTEPLAGYNGSNDLPAKKLTPQRLSRLFLGLTVPTATKLLSSTLLLHVPRSWGCKVVVGTERHTHIAKEFHSNFYWDRLGTWDPLVLMLAPGPTSPETTKYKESWGKFWAKDTERPREPNCHFWRAKSGSQEQKQSTEHALHTTSPKEGWAKPLSRPSLPTPRHNPNPLST